MTMTVTRLSSHKFNEDVGAAKRAADSGPVIITDGDKPAYVFLSHDLYSRLLGPTLREMVTQPGGDDIEFEPSRLSDEIFRPADRS
jgi:hypothetical protein